MCKVISSNQQFQQDYPILANKESQDLLVKIKEICNWKTHNPQYLVGLSSEEKIEHYLKSLRNIFVKIRKSQQACCKKYMKKLTN